MQTDGCLTAIIQDLEICAKIGIPHPDSAEFDQWLNETGGLGRLACGSYTNCTNSCLLRSSDNSTGVEVLQSRRQPAEECAIVQETQDPTF